MDGNLFETIFERLKAAMDHRTAFTSMQLATNGEDGRPKLRTVILRGFDEENAILTFITDARSSKVQEINAHPYVSFVGYDPGDSVQLRLEGEAVVDGREDRRRSFWNALRPHTLEMFRRAVHPGAPLDNEGEGGRSLEGGEDGYRHFCIVETRLTMIEWLNVSEQSHFRYRYRWSKDGWVGDRIAP